MPAIAKRLAKTYAPVKANGVAGIQSVVLIDNTPDVLVDRAHQLTCPSYEYQYPVDVFRQLCTTIPASTLAHHYHSLMNMPPQQPMREQRFFARYYRGVGQQHYEAYKKNLKTHGDKFWKRLAKAMTTCDLKNFNATTLAKCI
jgi:hypothetical protein